MEKMRGRRGHKGISGLTNAYCKSDYVEATFPSSSGASSRKRICQNLLKELNTYVQTHTSFCFSFGKKIETKLLWNEIRLTGSY